MTDHWPEKFLSKNFSINILYIQYSTFFEKSSIGIDIGPYTDPINLIFWILGQKNGVYQQIEIFSDEFILFKQHFGENTGEKLFFIHKNKKGKKDT